jgi:hypothetical protein
MFLNCSTCFGRHTAHHQELKTVTTNACKTRGCNYRFELLMMSGVSPETCCVEQLRNIGIINSTIISHLDYFYTIRNMMHGSTNIKLRKCRLINKHKNVSFCKFRTFRIPDCPDILLTNVCRSTETSDRGEIIRNVTN